MLRADVRFAEICLAEYMDLQSLLRFGKTRPKGKSKKGVTAAEFRRFARKNNAARRS